MDNGLLLKHRSLCSKYFISATKYLKVNVSDDTLADNILYIIRKDKMTIFPIISFALSLICLILYHDRVSFEPRHEKICLRGFRPGKN